MRRVVGLGVATAVLAAGTALAAAHGPSAYRATSGSYLRAGGATLGSTSSVQTIASPSVRDTARASEDQVVITVSDRAASVVALAIRVTPAGSTASTQVLACNSTSLAVRAGTAVEVTPLAGLCPDGRVSMPQGGKISLTFHRFLPAPKAKAMSAAPAQRFALLVGIRQYASGTEATVGGVGDVNAVRKALLGAGWPASHIMMITDKQATADGIRNGLAWLAAHSSSKSFSLFHYSGHVCIASRGPCPKGHTYLWSYDNHFLPEYDVVARMKRVQGRQWMDLSGCEGGAFDAGYHSATRLFTGSSKASETSYEEPQWGESVWTGLTWDRGYNQGLADPGRHPYHATIGQMAGYGIERTAAYTRYQNPGVQHPVMAGGSSSWTLSAPPGG